MIFGPKNAITRRKSMGTDLCIAGNDGVMRVQGMGGSGAKKGTETFFLEDGCAFGSLCHL